MNQIKDFFEYVFNMLKIWIIIQPWEQGLIVRRGKNIRKVDGGIYFKIPYLDSVYVQEVRMRMINLSMQTLTTKDKQTLTINSAVGYKITNIETLYQTLFHPEGMISNVAMSDCAEYVFNTNLVDIEPDKIEKIVLEKLNAKDYGLEFDYFKITNFAAVKTFRLIQDGQSWIANNLEVDKKK